MTTEIVVEGNDAPPASPPPKTGSLLPRIAALSAAWLFTPGLTLLSAQNPSPATSYAEIDERIEGEFLVELGAEWRYRVGVTEPEGEDGAWAELEYRDGDWKRGPSPLGYGAPGLATTLEGMKGRATTVYLRHVFDLDDPAIYDHIELRCSVDDGYVVYVNGMAHDRLHAEDGAVAHDSLALIDRGIETLPVSSSEMTFDLRPGPNTLAFIGLVHGDDRGSFEIRPRVYGYFRRNAEEDARRMRQLRESLAGERVELLQAYLQGAYLQRSGLAGEAIEHLARAALGDPHAPEPWQRMIECARADGSLAQLTKDLEERIRGGLTAPTLLDLWARTVLEDLGGSVAHIRKVARGLSHLPEEGTFADALWTAERLEAGEPLRIDCGSEHDHRVDGAAWSRDRFFTYGEPERRAPEPRTGVVRIAARRMGEGHALYRLPVPPGSYELRLCFNMGADESLDVLVNGVRAIRDLRGKDRPEWISIPARTHGSALELDLVARTSRRASIAAVEARALGARGFAELAGKWLETRGTEQPYALAQEAEADLELGRGREALNTYELAEATPGFSPGMARRLQALRRDLLPHIYTYASADELAGLPAEEAAGLVAEGLEAAESDAERAVISYLQGRIDQLAGRAGDAMIAFEELAFSDSPHTEPFLRLAECLSSSDLAPEAEDIVRTAIDSEVELTPALLRFWITLALGELGRDPWDVVADLAELPLELPEYSVVLPTSESAPRSWQYRTRQPPTVMWSQASYRAVDWLTGPGGFGWGSSLQGTPRTSWKDNILYARTGFHLPGQQLLFPHVRIALNDGGGVYLNGTLTHRVNGHTNGYETLPIRQGSFLEGENFIGIYGVNVWGEAYVDCGIVEPLGLLVRILRTLEHGPLRWNCGGAEYEDSQGNLWHDDRFFGHGVAWYTPESEKSPRIEDTGEDELYRSQRAYPAHHEGAASYRIPLPDGRYSVTLHFAESDPRFREPGKRRFGVELEGASVLEDWGPSAELGYARAGSRTFETKVTDDWLDVDFVHVKDGSLPSISALELRRVD